MTMPPGTSVSTIKTVCPYCGVGCGMRLQTENNRVVKVSGDPSHPANFGRLCTKGLTCAEALQDPDRLAIAYLRTARDHELRPVDTAYAIARVAHKLQAISAQHGPDAVAFYVSGQLSLEAQYVANKLSKGFIGTNNIDSNSRLCMSSAAAGYRQSLGADGPPGSYQDIEHSHCFFVIGSNMADCHPILFLRLLDQRKKAGAKLIVVDPRRTTTADKADLHLQIQPGTDLALLNGVLHLLVKNDRIARDFIAQHTEGWNELTPFLEAYSPNLVASITGLREEDIRQAAQWIGDAPEWMSFWTMGLNQSTHGTWHTNALCNLHLATGKICRPGSGPFSLTGQPNAMGGREVGYLAHGLPGQRTVLNAEDRAFTERLWGIPHGAINAQPGLDAVSLFRKLAEGKVKAIWIIGTNPIASLPNRQQVIAGLTQAELVITQDAFHRTETNRYADIILPGALWAEAEGVMVNSERNLTLMQKAVDPPGQTLPDWQIITRVARAMGFEQEFSYESAADVFAEIRLAWNPRTGYDLRGVDYHRLHQEPVQWPCPPGAASRNPLRYREKDEHVHVAFPTVSGKARFLARPYLPPAELPNNEYPFILNTGRLAHQWHTLTKTGKIAALNKLNPQAFVALHPNDAHRLDLTQGAMVRVRSRRGHAAYPVTVTDCTPQGQCFVPFHWNDLFGDELAINAVTQDAVDATSLQPELKQCAVRLEKIAAAPLEATAAPLEFHETSSPQISLLYGSQTGNAERIAHQLAQQFTAAGITVRLCSMSDYPTAALAKEQCMVIVTSTYGDGEAPENARSLWNFLQSSTAPTLPFLRYAVLGLGDSSYAQFCQCGRNFDTRLAALGARPLLPRTDCDSDFHATAAQWMTQLLAVFMEEFSPTENGTTFTSLASPQVTFPLPTVDTRHDRTHPFLARVLCNRRLNGERSSKDTRHYEFSLEGSGLTYEAGDALGVWPTNCPDLVAEILSHLRLWPETPVSLDNGGELPLADALLRHYEITRLSGRALDMVAKRSGDTALRALLQEGHASERTRLLQERQLIDLLHEYPAVRCNASELLHLLKPMQPRFYSLASSPKAHANQAHVTVRTVRYLCAGQLRKGAASTFLADRVGTGPAPLFIRKSPHFHVPPDPDTPLLMIGPGTGVAPFRGFLHERLCTGARGRNWLFFGEQHAASDFYYQNELTEFQRMGVLTRLDVAFSRDQAEKIYVQDRLREHGETVWAWLQEGATLYVCGDAAHMAKDVERTLLRIAIEHGGLSAEKADGYIQRLSATKRYLRDVY